MNIDEALSLTHCPKCGEPVFHSRSGLVACSARPGECGWHVRFTMSHSDKKKKGKK